MTNLFLYIISANIGIILFFPIILAPMIFKTFDPKNSTLYLRAFFPRFYLFLFVTTLISGLISFDFFYLLTLLICSFLFLLCRWPLTPAINKAKDNNNNKAFKRLHGLSVAVLLLQLFLMTSILVLETVY